MVPASPQASAAMVLCSEVFDEYEMYEKLGVWILMGPNAEKALSHSKNFKNCENWNHLRPFGIYIYISLFELFSLLSFHPPPQKKKLQTKSPCFQASILLMVAQWFEKYLRIA